MIQSIKQTHQPVLLSEVIEGLAIQPQGIYIDATFGRGGHSKAMIERLGAQGRLLVIDKDPSAIAVAAQQFGGDPRVIIEQGSFAVLREAVQQLGWLGKVNGILLDLGVSSPQLEDPQRGFSFMRDGPLDMRMDPSVGIDAATWLNSAKESAIAEVLREYGEERHARRIAARIVSERVSQPFLTTGHLAATIAAAHPSWEQGKHPATRCFQAIRIFINHELEELQTCLAQCLDVLAVGGRLAVISFHSLEDRIVKRFIRGHRRGDDLPIELPLVEKQLPRKLCNIGRAIKPSALEIKSNPRARSAVLRIAEKLL